MDKQEKPAQNEQPPNTNEEILVVLKEIAENIRVIKFWAEFSAAFYNTRLSQAFHASESLFEQMNANFIKDGAGTPD